MVELHRENREDYKTFIKIKSDQFQEFVVRPDMAASFFTWETDLVTKYLHRSIIVLSSCHNRSKSYYSRNE